MLSLTSKLAYFLFCTRRAITGAGMDCPSCGMSGSNLVDRKYFVTALRRCTHCQLLFRSPTTSPEEQAAFYQQDYEQGFTTTLPDAHNLRSYLERDFRGTEKDYATYLRVLEALEVESGQRLFDFGCSWGYGSWQLRRQ